MLAYVGILPRYGETRGTPHRVYSTVALYWHFVDLVWMLVVALLYVVPNLQGGSHGH
jgi:heme/copper-type cytochrome/quinol oxidase subunit 3